MSVGILLITHGNIGRDLVDTARSILGSLPLSLSQISVSLSANPDKVFAQAHQSLRQVDQGHGVLIITDIFGSTPSNIACRLGQLPQVNIIAGLNLPMLIRILNYPDLDLSAMAKKALSGGQDGVLNCLTRTSKENIPHGPSA